MYIYFNTPKDVRTFVGKISKYRGCFQGNVYEMVRVLEATVLVGGKERICTGDTNLLIKYAKEAGPVTVDMVSADSVLDALKTLQLSFGVIKTRVA